MVEVKNYFKVPKRQWRKWSEVARRTFNDVYMAMKKQSAFTHPLAHQQPRKHWKTVRWNAAWFAADSVRDAEKDLARG